MFPKIPITTIKITPAIILVIFITGCATIFTGTTDSITFTSNADPVRVYIGGRNVGTTPLTIDVNRQTSKGPMVRFEKEGYKTQEFYLEQKFNTVAILDITSIITSGGIDVLSGAIMEFSPRQYHVEMINTKTTSIDDQQQQIRFAKFVLFNSQNIQLDLATNGGEYTDTLVQIIEAYNSKSSNFEGWVTVNKEMLISTTNPEQFLVSLRKSQMTP